VEEDSAGVELPTSVRSSAGADEVTHRRNSLASQKPEREESCLLSNRSFLMHALIAADMMKNCGPPSAAAVDGLKSKMDNHKLAEWRGLVKRYAQQVHCTSLEHLCIKVVKKRVAHAYAMGTLLAVSLTIHDKCEERRVLTQFVEYVSHVLDIAKGRRCAVAVGELSR
jgi:hypothetical protein